MVLAGGLQYLPAMFPLRLLATSVCAAGMVLLVSVRPVRVDVTRGPMPGPQVSVIDVADGVAPEELPGIVRLDPGEHVTAVNDRSMASDLEAGVTIAALAPPSGGYLDLTVSGPGTQRRVLILLH